jgi:hypothetical protein
MDKAAGESFAPTTREKQPKTKEDDNLDVTLSRYSFQAGAYADTPTRPNAHTLRPRRYALPTPKRSLVMRQVLHAPPGGDNRRIPDVSNQQVAESFCKIHILFGEEVEALDRFLTQGWCVLNITLIHFEDRAIQRRHLPAPIEHFIDVLINDVHSLL